MPARILISFLICVAVTFPAMLASVPAVALLLLTEWDGRTTIFGNAKWGRATDHFVYATRGEYLREFVWLVWRNPVNNLMSLLSVAMRPYELEGDPLVGDKQRGGFYAVRMGLAWEYYWIRPYTVFGSRRCVRVRAGWKISGNTDARAAFVFVVNPWKRYLGA